MSTPSPTLIDRLNRRRVELDRACAAALSCAIALPPTGPAALIPTHLHDLRARLAALQADLALLIALAQAATLPAPEEGAA